MNNLLNISSSGFFVHEECPENLDDWNSEDISALRATSSNPLDGNFSISPISPYEGESSSSYETDSSIGNLLSSPSASNQASSVETPESKKTDSLGQEGKTVLFERKFCIWCKKEVKKNAENPPHKISQEETVHKNCHEKVGEIVDDCCMNVLTKAAENFWGTVSGNKLELIEKQYTLIRKLMIKFLEKRIRKSVKDKADRKEMTIHKFSVEKGTHKVQELFKQVEEYVLPGFQDIIRLGIKNLSG